MRWLVVATLLLVATPVSAHPGRLDAKGCHVVRERFVYKDGRALEVGEYHCHRPLGAMKLDGLERLPDGKGDHAEPRVDDHHRGLLSP